MAFAFFFQAAKLALERGWAINLGGGFHHCSATRGGGFCAYADITIAIRMVLDHMTSVKTVMIIDLDAHQVRTFFDRRKISERQVNDKNCCNKLYTVV